MDKYCKRLYEAYLVKDMKEKQPNTSVSGKTINILVAKKCEHCSTSLYVHNKNEDIIFSGCEPCIINISLDKKDNEILIKGTRSTKRVRCSRCKRVHLLSTFKEVKDGVSQT